MKVYGLIGYPLGHSFSKKYFTEKFIRERIADCSYEKFPIQTIDELKTVLVQNPNICGLIYKIATVSGFELTIFSERKYIICLK